MESSILKKGVVYGVIAVALGIQGRAEGDRFLSSARQLTLEGRRAGEGYFSADGRKLVFQSERQEDNPFYQIYLLDLESGDVQRVSNGAGKTTCAWLMPSGDEVLYASTHEDGRSAEKQAAALKERAEGKMKRYSWDYDEEYDLIMSSLDGRTVKNLTRTRGYDAEASASPDGEWIVFSSNRHAYASALSGAEAERLKIDQQYFLDLYMMRRDGSEVKRLTDVPGYDGGPFFSADGQRICWRRFDEKGEKAEIWTMKSDGTDQRQVTKIGAMSWSPYFHPSGDYLIFTTNVHGFDNFELYLIDAAGQQSPVRVTDTAGFDGLPVFSPDGKSLCWTSNRTADKSSQLFLAEWDDAAARAALGLPEKKNTEKPPATVAAAPGVSPAITEDDLRTHVLALTSEAMEGRLTGTEGEQRATAYAQEVFAALGLQPASVTPAESFFQPFEFTAGVELGEGNELVSGEKSWQVDQDFRPLSFSILGEVDASPVVFAGYGIELAAEGTDKPGYSSFFHLDVKDKWVLVFRYLPEKVSGELRQRMNFASSLRFKAKTVKERGARGLIVVSGPKAQVRESLVPLSFDASLANSGLAALSVSDAVVDEWLKPEGKSLAMLQEEWDAEQPRAGFTIKDLSLRAKIDLKQERRTGRNVLARLPASRPSKLPPVLIGAHIDHLGREASSNSRASDDEKSLIHVGADDNASGTAALFEIAQWLVAEQKEGRLVTVRDIIFAAWSGEELGLIGSTAYVKALAKKQFNDESAPLGEQLAAVLNMDMIGRFQKTLVLQGLGSSDFWKPEIEKRNVPLGLPLTLQEDCFAPTDTTAFYPRRVPILNAFTGSHDDYHRPTDTPDKLNFPAMVKISRLFGTILRTLAQTESALSWKEHKTSAQQGQRSSMRAYLGTVPDYSQGDVSGVKLSGVSAVGPAAKAGVKGGDTITALGGKEIKNIYDYTYALGELKIGVETEIVVLRGEEKLTLKITPQSRD